MSDNGELVEARDEHKVELYGAKRDAEVVAGLGLDTPAKSEQNPRQRSRVADGKTLLPSTDGRGVWARLMKSTFQALQAHCAGALSETQRLMARRISTLEAELVYLEDEFATARAEGREPDTYRLELYGRLADRQRRLAEGALGWDRKQRDVTQSLDAIMNEPADVNGE